jgi:hypothetical protein
MSPPSTESAVFEISTASRETSQPAVETRSEFRYENRRPRADSQPTCLNALTLNHTTLLPRSRQKTCMVWKLKTTMAPSRGLSNEQAPGLVFPSPTSPRGSTTRRRNSFRVPLRKSPPPRRFTAHLPECPHLKPYKFTSAIASEDLYGLKLWRLEKKSGTTKKNALHASAKSPITPSAIAS